jgi:DNA end-binding protein Ku
MARAIWSGSISFGLVNIPVKVYSAVRDRDVHFHQIHEKTRCRIRHKLYCPEEDREIPSDEIVKGFEIAPDQYVIVSPEELDAIAPEQTHTIDITDFVDLASIDPIYYEQPYYVLPDERAGKAYGLLLSAMLQAQKVGIAKFILHNKENLVALRPLKQVICMEIMRFADEVVSVDDLEIPKKATVGDKELKMAEQLIESLAADFDPANYRDEYTEKIRALIDKKAQGEEIVSTPQAEEGGGKVIDLMAALEKSLAKAADKKQAKKTNPPKQSKRKRA